MTQSPVVPGIFIAIAKADVAYGCPYCGWTDLTTFRTCRVSNKATQYICSLCSGIWTGVMEGLSTPPGLGPPGNADDLVGVVRHPHRREDDSPARLGQRHENSTLVISALDIYMDPDPRGDDLRSLLGLLKRHSATDILIALGNLLIGEGCPAQREHEYEAAASIVFGAAEAIEAIAQRVAPRQLDPMSARIFGIRETDNSAVWCDGMTFAEAKKDLGEILAKLDSEGRDSDGSLIKVEIFNEETDATVTLGPTVRDDDE